MTENGKTWLAEIRNEPKFRQVMKEMKEWRPVVPKYQPQGTTESTEEHIETIKYKSALQAGFDLIYLHLTGEKLDE